MTWEDIMRRVLPPIGGVPPHVTGPGAFGAGVKEGRKPPSTIPHKGVDFNYIGGREAQLNKSNPPLYSPVAGVVINAGEGSVGRIAIPSSGIVWTQGRPILVSRLTSKTIDDIYATLVSIPTMGLGQTRQPLRILSDKKYHLSQGPSVH
jgi:hypothetical protein